MNNTIKNFVTNLENILINLIEDNARQRKRVMQSESEIIEIKEAIAALKGLDEDDKSI